MFLPSRRGRGPQGNDSDHAGLRHGSHEVHRSKRPVEHDGRLNAVDVLASRRVYEGRVVNLRVDTLPGNHGRPHDVEVVEHAQAVGVIVRPNPGELLLVRQYRHPLGRDNWEIVAGGMDPGESPEAAAARELREETGYRAKRVERLWSAFTAPGFCEERLHFCLVDGYDVGAPEPEDDESIEIGIFSLDALWEKIRRDELPDAKTQIAVLWALHGRG